MKPRILVVDDEESIREFLDIMLRKEGYDVTCVEDGQKAIDTKLEELLKEVQERLSANLKAMDPEAMLKAWLPATLKGFEQLQEMFLSRMGSPGDKRK